MQLARLEKITVLKKTKKQLNARIILTLKNQYLFFRLHKF